MPHEETIKERAERRLDRLQKAVDVCSSADAIDAAFYIGEDSAHLADEQISKFENLNREFYNKCECKKKEKIFLG